jgi:sigma-B regulation protein RsbQ
MLKDAVLARNNVRVIGQGEHTIVFAHGFGCDQNMWRFIAPAFEPHCKLVLFDYVGCGGSDRSAFSAARYGSLDGYAQDLLDVCDALDIEGATFVGHSVSAMVGVLAAARQPARFARLVMIGPSPRYINDAPGYFGGFDRADIDGLLSVMDHNYIGWAQALAPMVMGNPDRPALSQELERSFCSTDPEAAQVFARATFYADNRDDLATVRVPSLIIQVSNDAIAPVEVGRYLHERLPDSELVLLEAIGHCPHMSHPAQTAQAIHAYLERQGAL